jgi:hypothetical protein
MTARLRSMSDDELGRALERLDVAWPPEPDLRFAVIGTVQRGDRGRIVRLPLSRPKRILLVAAATVIMLAGAAVAAKIVIDLGAVVVRVTPAPTGSPPPTSEDAFGRPLSVAEAEALLRADLRLPSALGPPDHLWADELITDREDVVRITATWDPGPELPAIEGTSHGAVLMRFEGDVNQAFKDVYQQTGVIEPVRIDGTEATWTTGTHTLRLLTSEGVRYVSVTGNVLLWRDGPFTMRLETNLPQAETIRIAASSAGTS